MTPRREAIYYAMLFALFGADPACAQIYGGVDTDGALVLSSFRSTASNAVIVGIPAAPRASPRAAAEPAALGRPQEQVRRMVEEVAARVQVDPRLLHAVIRVESNYNPGAVSPKGAGGLMQLMPGTAQRFGVKNRFDPLENIEGGARYLKWLLGQFNNDLELVVAAYNAGEQSVIRAGYRIPDYPETRNYVPRVLAHYARFGLE